METVVYADMMFMINFMINIILLKITEIFSKQKFPLFRQCFAGAFGAVYAIFMFMPHTKILYSFPFKMIISLIMIIIAKPKSGVLKTVKLCSIFYLVCFTFAGILLALIYLTGSSSPKLYGGIFYFDISLTTIVISSVSAYIVLQISSSIFARNKSLGIKSIKICMNGKECVLNALSDTGNLLTDPISRLPVVIAEKNFILPLFPHGVPDIANEPDICSKLRIIPYSSLGNNSGIMAGFVPDSLIIDGRRISDIIVGISDTTLSQTNEYNALFNPNIINNRRS